MYLGKPKRFTIWNWGGGIKKAITDSAANSEHHI